MTPAAPKLTIDQARHARCVRAPNLRAIAAQKRTMSVRFRLSSAAPVKFSLERWTGKRGASKCPPATGKAKSGGRKIPGVYSPQTGRSVNARAGVNSVTVAATGRKGKRLHPGTYLLTVTSGTTTSRTIWVLANFPAPALFRSTAGVFTESRFQASATAPPSPSRSAVRLAWGMPTVGTRIGEGNDGGVDHRGRHRRRECPSRC